MRGVRLRTLYKLLGRTYTSGYVNVVFHEVDHVSSCVVDLTMLWHQRMGHISEKNLRAMNGKCMVKGVPDCSEGIDFCEHCVYGKHSQVKFPSGAMRANGIMEVVHSDVFGLVSVPSLRKSLYYVSFIENFYRMTWFYFMKKKFEVFDRFQEFKALVENQSDMMIKVL